jgi:aspartate 1-decarboxylase
MRGTLRKVLFAKIHAATVTEANVEYEGSITIPEDILSRAGLLPHEAVSVWNITTGTRFETYILRGEANTQEFCVNGAAAHLVSPGDRVIIAAFVMLPHEQAVSHSPTVVFMSPDNSVKEIRDERPAQKAAGM